MTKIRVRQTNVPKSASKSLLLAAVEGLQAQVVKIGGTVILLQENLQKSTETTRSERGNKSFRKRAQEKQMKPGCESCKSTSTER